MSRGKSETEMLRKNLEEQLERLVSQLADLEDNRDDLEADEYSAMKQDTIEQMKEFGQALTKLNQGELSLVDDINRMQLAIQASISDAFQTPDIIRFFAKKQPGQLRTRLSELDRDEKVGKLPSAKASELKAEILTALARLGEPLSAQERAFMETNARAATREFAQASEGVESTKVMAAFSSQVQSADN